MTRDRDRNGVTGTINIKKLRDNDATLTMFILPKEEFEMRLVCHPQIVQELSEAIAVNHTLTSIDLSKASHMFSFSEATNLANAISQHPNLTKINWAGREVSNGPNTNKKFPDEGAKAIAKAIKNNHNLTDVNLSNHLSNVGIQYIAQALSDNLTLTALDLHNNNTGDDEAMYLADAFRANSTLRVVNLSRCNISDTGIIVIAKALETNTRLMEINVSENHINDIGAEAMAEALKINQTLTKISLRINNITDKGAKDIAEALKVNRSLMEIDLSFGKITDKGARDIAEALKVNQSLTSINLTYNLKITPVGTKDLAESINSHPSLTKLELTKSSSSSALLTQIETTLSINKEEQKINREKRIAAQPLLLTVLPSDVTNIVADYIAKDPNPIKTITFAPHSKHGHSKKPTDPILQVLKDSEQKAEDNNKADLEAAIKASLETTFTESPIAQASQNPITLHVPGVSPQNPAALNINIFNVSKELRER